MEYLGQFTIGQTVYMEAPAVSVGVPAGGLSESPTCVVAKPDGTTASASVEVIYTGSLIVVQARYEPTATGSYTAFIKSLPTSGAAISKSFSFTVVEDGSADTSNGGSQIIAIGAWEWPEGAVVVWENTAGAIVARSNPN